jgi:hypothetical protein
VSGAAQAKQALDGLTASAQQLSAAQTDLSAKQASYIQSQKDLAAATMARAQAEQALNNAGPSGVGGAMAAVSAAITAESAATKGLAIDKAALKDAEVALANAKGGLTTSSTLLTAAQKAESASVSEGVATFNLMGPAIAAVTAILGYYTVAAAGAMAAISEASKADDIVHGMAQIAGGIESARQTYEGFQQFSATHSFINPEQLSTSLEMLTRVGISFTDATKIVQNFANQASLAINPSSALATMVGSLQGVISKAAIGAPITARSLTGLTETGATAAAFPDATKLAAGLKDSTIYGNELVTGFKNMSVDMAAVQERATDFHTLLGNIVETSKQWLEAMGSPTIVNPEAIAALQHIQEVIQGSEDDAKLLGQKLAEAFGPVAEQMATDLKTALSNDSIGQGMAAMLIKWGATAAASIGTAVWNAVAKSQTATGAGDILFNLTNPAAAQDSGMTAKEYSIMHAGDVANASAQRQQNFFGSASNLGSDESGAGGSATQTFNRPTPPGGGGGSNSLSDDEKEWTKITAAVTQYDTNLYKAQQGLMSMDEVGDKLGTDLQKAFAKAYDHEAIQNYIDLRLTGDAKILASAINMETARVQANAKANQDIKLGIASVYEAVAAGITKATEAASNQAKIIENVTSAAVTDFASGFASAFVSFASGAKTAGQAFSDFAKTFLTKIADMIIQQEILNALSHFGLGGGAGASGSIAAPIDGGSFSFGGSTGGIVGQLTERYAVPAGYFNNAPHYDAGGAVGIVAHQGEVILNAAQQRNLTNNMGQTNNVVITVNSDGSGSSTRGQGTQMASAIKSAVLKVIQDQQRSGGLLQNKGR